jgi:hypothetical protein
MISLQYLLLHWVIKVSVPAGCVGTEQCAATWDVQLPPMEEATLSYKFMFSPGYIFGLGGKLPGLCAHGGAPSHFTRTYL